MCLGIPARLVELDTQAPLGVADVAGVRRSVSTALCPDAEPGDWVLVHVGFAISVVDEAEAAATLALLQEMGAEFEQELAELKGSVIE
jgi:hydrogenase expression/formation protein HypC